MASTSQPLNQQSLEGQQAQDTQQNQLLSQLPPLLSQQDMPG